MALWFSLHLDLCLDSALHNDVLCGRLTPHALSRTGAGVSSCWLPGFGVPLLSPCCLLERPCDPPPGLPSCTPLYVVLSFLIPAVCPTSSFPQDSFFLKSAYLENCLSHISSSGFGSILEKTFCPPPQSTHLPCRHIGCPWAVTRNSSVSRKSWELSKSEL